jgi:hypothetical protein
LDWFHIFAGTGSISSILPSLFPTEADSEFSSVELYGKLPLSGPKYSLAGIGRMPLPDPSTPAPLTVVPHHFKLFGLYPTAKNITRPLIATPAVKAAEST